MDNTYWKKQKSSSEPLFPEIAWSKPEQRARAGKLGIIGGNGLGFASVASSYSLALETGVGEVKVVLPDVLKKQLPSGVFDATFSHSTPSGSFAKDSLADMRALAGWANGILLIGDTGRNSETAITLETFVREYTGALTLTRDAIDALITDANLLANRPNTMFVGSFAQVQKLFRGVYYPKMLSFSMPLTQFIEALHKFTISYPITLVTVHSDMFVIAHAGDIVTQPCEQIMRVWRGDTATQIATYWLWNPSKTLESAATAIAF